MGCSSVEPQIPETPSPSRRRTLYAAAEPGPSLDGSPQACPPPEWHLHGPSSSLPHLGCGGAARTRPASLVNRPADKLHKAREDECVRYIVAWVFGGVDILNARLSEQPSSVDMTISLENCFDKN